MSNLNNEQYKEKQFTYRIFLACVFCLSMAISSYVISKNKEENDMFIVGSKVLCSISVIYSIFSSKLDVEGVVKNVGASKIFVDFSNSAAAKDPEYTFNKKQLVYKNDCILL